MRKRQPRPPEDASSTRLPVWARDAITVAGVVIGVGGLVLTMVQVLGNDETGTTVTPRASIREVTFEPDEVVGNGPFQLVDLASEVILFVRKQDDGGDPRWIPVEASTDPAGDADAGRVDGNWEAVFPVNEEGRFTWQVLIVESAGLGASGGLDDIRVNGPDSELVIAASDVFEGGQD